MAQEPQTLLGICQELSTLGGPLLMPAMTFLGRTVPSSDRLPHHGSRRGPISFMLDQQQQQRSFGHFQAKEHGVASGTLAGFAASDSLRRGLCLTRLSVTKLNHLVTEQLVSCGVPAVGISPFGTWKTAFKNVSEDGIAAVKDVLHSGYVPVLHGDCALDLEQHCCILSGDTITEVLAKEFSPRRVVFLTDVKGIYSCPPDTPGARLVDSIIVDPSGNMEPPVRTSVVPHDTTGGVLSKLQAAVNMVSQSHGAIPVLICKLDSEAAERACLTGELKEGEGEEE
ncbi:uncharacterized protein LOC128323006 isoform X2 [Hemicordylus capensis]|uniref:uncharacterized protein LOC128323006 isoform X2 n=1 Tax=Hemicordylus capensis TaxID=884348 RepID=UPI002304AB7C|nr:uncharacterized protein LOC128323006 isoform X2 [Hemicordylus capensis]